MIHLFLKLIGWSQKTAAEPLDKRRRVAVLILIASLPVILGLWGLSMRYSAAGYRSVGEAIQAPLAESKEALAVLQNGWANLRMIADALWENLQNDAAPARDAGEQK